MNAADDRAKSVFLNAVEIVAPEERRAFVESQCDGDESLRGEVEALLRHQQSLGSFLDTPPAGLDATVDWPLSEGPGTVVGPYKLLQQIGEGGMGVVFMAEQSQPLQRTVAVKIIKPGMDTRRVITRFEAERQAVAMMDHPNIAKVLDAGTTDSGRPYFAMELVKGVPITKYCDDKRVPLRGRLGLFVQVCQAVQHAHQKGIIHRDIKPNNVLVAEYDDHAVPKVIDFGVAKATAQKLTERTVFTEFGQVLGTMEYMSPEQAKLNQLDVDTRSDIYSLGVLLYELLTGSTPFERKRLRTAAFDEMLRIIREEEPLKPSTRLSSTEAPGSGETLGAIAANRNDQLAGLRKQVRGELDWIVMKSLEKERGRRYDSANDLGLDVQRHLRDEPVLACPPSVAYRFRKSARRNKTALTAAALLATALLGGAGASTWQAWRATKAEIAARADRDRALAAEAKTKALGEIPTIDAHVRARRFGRAFELLRQVERVVPEDGRLDELRTACSSALTIVTDPPAVTVSRKRADDSDGGWERLGETPIQNRRLARGVYYWKFEKPGYAAAEGLANDGLMNLERLLTGADLRVELDREDVAPRDMVRVRPVVVGSLWRDQGVSIPPFWIDRFEVTNRQFKSFVDQGGYRRKEFWENRFEKGGRALSWEEAMDLFRDSTGRPGPAAWAAGSYGDGQDEFPVSGVSWYEAAAFAKFAGKSLPTIYHWTRASGRGALAEEIIPRSNLGGTGLARVGQYRGLGPSGTCDMAGNVKEWCWNSAGDGLRYVLGGAWDEREYMFTSEDARAAIDREKNMGFRCINHLDGQELSNESLAEVKQTVRDVRAEKILSDDAFQAVKGFYAYDKAKPLHAVIGRPEETAAWIHQRVAVDAAYGNERLIIHLFLPRDASPPYQPVVFWPGGGAFLRDVVSPADECVGFIINSGRALVCPVYQGTYERRVKRPGADGPWEHSLQQAKDLSRCIDYLRTRKEDFDTGAIGYYGVSWGASAVQALAVEDRIEAAVLVDGGLEAHSGERRERDPVHYLPRITIPVLMLNGRYDAGNPPKEAQEPMFRLLGTDPARKRYTLTDSSHVAAPTTERIRETLSWFDQHLGPVTKKHSAGDADEALPD
jgi:serine/threonine protein kinase/pimeloyl-ACP methyl ester carboxylesterase